MKNKKIPPKNQGRRNKTAGSNYERDIRAEFVKLGFTKAKSSRQASRIYDDCGIDHWGISLPSGRLIFTQCKSGYKNARPKADVEFKNQQEKVLENFEVGSKELDNPLQILFHKIDGYKPENHLVTLKFQDFIEIFKEYVKASNKTT